MTKKISSVNDFIEQFKEKPEAEILVTLMYANGGSRTCHLKSADYVNLLNSDKSFIEIVFCEYVPKSEKRRRGPG